MIMVSKELQPRALIFLTETTTIGTCVVVIAMLATFSTSGLPGAKPQHYAPSDIASFYDVFSAVVELSWNCVEKKSQPQAGWSFTGESVMKSLAGFICVSTCCL